MDSRNQQSQPIDERRECLNDILETVALLLKYADYSLEEVQLQLKDCFSRIEVPDGPEVPPEDEEVTSRVVQLLGRMLGVWHNDEDYADSKGDPKALSMKGEGSNFETLYRKAARVEPQGADAASVDEAAALLLKHNSIKLTSNEMIIPISRVFSIKNNSSVQVTAQLGYFAEYARTVHYNTFQGRGGRYQKVARERNIPTKYLPMLTALLEERGLELLQEVDEFLVGHQVEEGTSEEVACAGVGVYLGISKNEAFS